MGVRWRAADGAITRLSVNKVSSRRLLELAMAAWVWECVGARLMELCRTKCQLSQEAPTLAGDIMAQERQYDHDVVYPSFFVVSSLFCSHYFRFQLFRLLVWFHDIKSHNSFPFFT